MTASQLPYGPIMIDLEGLNMSASEKDKINHPNAGAVILFKRNFSNPQQVIQLIKQIRAARNGPILIAVDQEGGSVQRFQNGCTPLPSASSYEAKGKQSVKLATLAGWLMASELLALGIDFSFAPVLDVDCGISEIIADRSFSKNPLIAATLAGAFRQGMRQAGMAATGKHFPGHGAVSVDSHLDLPVDARCLNSIRQKDLIPFERLIADGIEAIMPAHIIYEQVCSQPAGFSKIWITKILRKEFNFNGVVFSDDLSMEGASYVGDYPRRVKLAMTAGCDMVLVCNNPEAATQVLNAMPIQNNSIRQHRLISMQGKRSIDWQQLQHAKHWQQASKTISESNGN